MLLGYNTNGFAHHDPAAALELLAEIGYQSVALTLDHGLLNPFAADLADQIDRFRQLLGRWGLRSVVETGDRFLLNPASSTSRPWFRPSRQDESKGSTFSARRSTLPPRLAATAARSGRASCATNCRRRRLGTDSLKHWGPCWSMPSGGA